MFSGDVSGEKRAGFLVGTCIPLVPRPTLSLSSVLCSPPFSLQVGFDHLPFCLLLSSCLSCLEYFLQSAPNLIVFKPPTSKVPTDFHVFCSGQSIACLLQARCFARHICLSYASVTCLSLTYLSSIYLLQN